MSPVTIDLLTANDTLGAHAPSWYAATAMPFPPQPPLQGEAPADVCVIGGGYTGVSAALHLAESGLDVVLLEANRIGGGASGRNGGQVGSGQRQDQAWLERHHGETLAHALWDMAEEAKTLVRDRIARHAIACDLQPGIAYVAHRQRDVAHYADAVAKLARDYRYEEAEFLDRAGTQAALGSRAFYGGMLDRGGAHLHPLDFALGLARAAEAAGVRLCEQSRVLAIDPGDPARVRTATGAIRARFVLVACNGYLGDLLPEVAARVMPINNFIVATESLGAHRAAALIPGNIAAADSRFVVNYWRLSRDHRLLFGGGESYGYRFPRDIAGLVRPRLEAIYPDLRGIRIDHAWGGTLAITVSRLPAFQRPGPNVLAAGGYSGHGVALATLAGKIMAEAITGTAGRFDVLAALVPPPFPGGAGLRAPLLALAMSWYALRDRL